MRKDNLLNRYIMRIFKVLYVCLNVSIFGLIINLSCVGQLGVIKIGMMSEYEKWIFSITIALYSVTFLCVVRLYMGFRVGYLSNENLIYCQILSSFIAMIFSYISFVGMTFKFQNPFPFLIACVIEALISVLWSFCATKLYRLINKPLRTVILYCNSNDYRRITEVKKFSWNFKVENEIKITNETATEILELLEKVEAVFVSGLDASMQNDIVSYCVDKNIKCYLAPLIGNVIMLGGKHNQAFSVPIIDITRSSPSLEYLLIKRLFDIFVSIIGIVVTSPIMLLTAIVIKLYDKGPVFYKQIRLTKNGKEFQILKFRSMRVDAEKDGVARLSTAHDNRITPLGKIIRATRIDELPQFLNILKGDMSLVGPRPERPEIVNQYLAEIPEFNLRLQVKAGLTGYAQVYGKYNTNPYDKLEMDLMYINKMSVLTDLKLMIYTVRILFEKESTTGIDAGQTTALT